jgi:hypothetical protein
MSGTGVSLQDVGVGRDLNISGVTVGFTWEQVRALIEAERQGADEKIAEAGRRLGVTQGAMRTMLATVGQADVPEERLVEKLAEVFKQTRKAAAAIDYEAALEEYTRKRAPLAWAATQNNLGNALQGSASAAMMTRCAAPWPPMRRRSRNARASAPRSTGR